MLVHKLLKAQKKDPEFVKGLAAKQSARHRKLSLTIIATEELLRTQHNLWRSSQIVDVLKQRHDLQVRSAYVSSVLRNVLGMRYKCV